MSVNPLLQLIQQHSLTGQKLRDSYIMPCYPKTKDDLVSILNHPNYKGKKIGLLDSAYSWENLFGESETVLINFVHFNSMDGNNQKRVKLVDLEKGLVTISGGCTILQKHGELGIERGLPSCVVCTDAHYAGISSTGCHVSYTVEGSTELCEGVITNHYQL